MDITVIIRNDDGDLPLVSKSTSPVYQCVDETELQAVHGAITAAGMAAMVSAGFDIGQVRDVWGKAVA